MSSFSFTGNRAIYAGLGIGTAVLTGALSYFYYKYWRRDNELPIKWRRVGTLEQINLFPIKSCDALQLPAESEFLCEVLGLSHKGIRDRGLMLINENLEIVTPHIHPKLVSACTELVKKFELVLNEDRKVLNEDCKVLNEDRKVLNEDRKVLNEDRKVLNEDRKVLNEDRKVLNGDRKVLNGDRKKQLVVDFDNLADKKKSGRGIQVTFRGAKLDVVRCGRKYDRWFSRFILNSEWGLYLVYYPKLQQAKSITYRIINSFRAKKDLVSSYMLINLASVDDLNNSLPDISIDPMQFRGNFHLKMDDNEPSAENKWQWVRIGDKAVFRKAAPCTLSDIETVEGDAQKNLLAEFNKKSLSKSYSNPNLGLRLCLRQAGAIKANDVIYVEDV